MNREDEFWHFIMKAVLNEGWINRKFYFDSKNDCVFSLQFDDSKIKVHYRNVHTKKTPELEKYFEEVLRLFSENRPERYVEIPQIPFSDKKTFLLNYAANLDNHELRIVLFEEVNNYSEEDKFDFKFDLRNFDFRTYAQFDMERGRFTNSKGLELINSIGLTDIKKVMW